jgi:hypothetical protein
MNIEQKRRNAELLRVKASMEEMEINILEKEQEIDRLKGQLEIQRKKVEELENKIKGVINE